MSKTTKPKTCPQCGAPVPEEAPQGLCPRCVLAAATVTAQTATTPVTPDIPPLETVSQAFPQLEVIELIGAGGMGAVFKARQPKLDRLVALKVLSANLAKDPAFAERFSREAKVLARLNHPGIVTVYDFGQADHLFYLTMEYVDGVNLRQAMAAGRFSPSEALAVVPKICEALQYAHETGILHRDIKPENILIDEHGRVKIADFGIAKLVEKTSDQITLTAHGAAVGTPHYMAPEQLEQPQGVDQRADIYSLGVVFYEMLTGELPLGRFDLPSEKTDVDPRVDPVVLRTLERDREKRYRSATEVKTGVESVLTPPPRIPEKPKLSQPAAEVSSSGSSAQSSAETQRTPHKAIAAATLSSLGLFLALPWFLFMAAALAFIGSHRAGVNLVELIIILGVAVVLIGPLLIAGMLTGVSTVHDLRGSPAPRPGLGLATFSVAAGPLVLIDLLLLCLLFGIPAFLVMRAFPTLLALLILAVPTLVAMIVIDWAVYRRIRGWADRTATEPRPPQRRGSKVVVIVLLALVFFIFLGGALLVLLPASFLTLRRVTSAPEPIRLAPIASRVHQHETTDEPAWVNGRPALELDLNIPPGLVTTFSLVQSNSASWEPLSIFSAYVVAADRTPFQGTLQYGWTTSKEDQQGKPPFLVRLVDTEGSRTSTGGPLNADWHANVIVNRAQQTPELFDGDRSKILLASRSPAASDDVTADPEQLWIHIATDYRSRSVKDTTLKNSATIGTGSINWEEIAENP